MGDTFGTTDLPKTSCDMSPKDSTSAIVDLTRRHFSFQGERPGHLGDVDLLALDPALRGLLFTDGTVTRTLEVHWLSPVSVEVVDQQRSPVSSQIARTLDVPAGFEAVRRRVIIGLDSSSRPAIWAESHIVPDRLPDGFLEVLDGSPEGIGQSLQQVKLESWREMLCFGLDLSPTWAGENEDAKTTVLRRFYRLITRGQPAMLISESIAVEQRSGSYRLAHQ